jgi:hypothetical protein
MKVCAKNREAVAMLAIGALEAREAEALRAHAASCAGCRGYLAEMMGVVENVRAAQAPQEGEHALFLHRRVRQALRQAAPRPNFSWRLVIPTVCVLLLLMVILPRRDPISPARPSAPQAHQGGTPVKSLDPTILNYQMAANQSLEKLDAVLTEQGKRTAPASPVYRAGSIPSEAAD